MKTEQQPMNKFTFMIDDAQLTIHFVYESKVVSKDALKLKSRNEKRLLFENSFIL